MTPYTVTVCNPDENIHGEILCVAESPEQAAAYIRCTRKNETVVSVVQYRFHLPEKHVVFVPEGWKDPEGGREEPMEEPKTKKIVLYAYLLPEFYYSDEKHFAECEGHAPYGITHCAWRVTIAMPESVRYDGSWNECMENACVQLPGDNTWYMLFLDITNNKMYGFQPEFGLEKFPIDDIEVLGVERIC